MTREVQGAAPERQDGAELVGGGEVEVYRYVSVDLFEYLWERGEGHIREEGKGEGTGGLRGGEMNDDRRETRECECVCVWPAQPSPT